jgi:U11/U12 small nuclear ribonucleoprotein SNRNP48
LFLITFVSLSLEKESVRSNTREEVLAEERDYKRRRMSYRSKKMKRNPTEV